ncbi:TetR/AcrR family transcriptional regulator [Liquorilactobacillus sicerae]|uniref:TetR/AcrR family transcriptional regulator n=1 Tax=Liquorilactobacillus sicerae TaxID=1416943 RepID=UPI0024817300|nr:TetR/AcrR family transcriptional regulator [Liquorilactobacillus sicerae]
MEVIKIKREDRKALNRQKIIDAACKLIIKHGFKNTSVHDISRLSGISYVTMYKYFNDKQSLFKLVAKNLIDQQLSVFKKILTDEDVDFLTRLERLTTYQNLSPELHSELKKTLKQFPEIKEYFNQQLLIVWKLIIKAGRNSGFIQTSVSDKVIFQLFTALWEYLDQISNAEIKQFLPGLGQLLLFGLKGNQLKK